MQLQIVTINNKLINYTSNLICIELNIGEAGCNCNKIKISKLRLIISKHRQSSKNHKIIIEIQKGMHYLKKNSQLFPDYYSRVRIRCDVINENIYEGIRYIFSFFGNQTGVKH